MHKARKRFGQNFLHDHGIIRRIIRAIAPHESDQLVEIGPGLGALTEELLAEAGELDAIELDRDLPPFCGLSSSTTATNSASTKRMR